MLLDTAPHAADQADAILIPCRSSSFDLDAIGASMRLARNAGKPAYVVINAAPVQGVETAEAITAIRAAGVNVCPVVLHHRKPLRQPHPRRTDGPRNRTERQSRAGDRRAFGLAVRASDFVTKATNDRVREVTF